MVDALVVGLGSKNLGVGVGECNQFRLQIWNGGSGCTGKVKTGDRQPRTSS